MITVFTPSYNRSKELKRLYKSLLTQKNVKFEWLIVDDGSVDDTKNYITQIKKESKINIRYIYKENGGKQSAYNLGLEEAKGNIFLCIDSDDILSNNVLKNIEEDFKKIDKEENICGIMYMQSYIDYKNKIIGTYFPKNIDAEYYYNIYGKYGVKGDKLIVLKTKIAKQYPFPLIKNEKFVPEALVFNRISKKYKMKISNMIAAEKTYLENGYSSNYFSLVKRNPKGNALYFKEKYDIEKSFYNVYGYILFCLYAGQKFNEIYKNHKAKFKILILYIPTKILSKIR